MDRHIIEFTSFNRRAWLKQISNIYLEFAGDKPSVQICFSFSRVLGKDNMKPLHVVTFACLIHYLLSKGHKVSQTKENADLFDYVFNELNFAAYWSGGKNHVEAVSSQNIFNLWRIIESEKDLYAKQVEEYFKRNYFADKDLSAISISLVEAFYNVFDHADAKGNAFSIIYYDEPAHILSYAVADFGMGIPTSVRRFKAMPGNDSDLIKWAIKDNSTVHSTSRNKGFGMGNILSAAATARIFSEHGLLVKEEDEMHTYQIDEFSFPGTLIYLEIDLGTFEEEEILDTFTI